MLSKSRTYPGTFREEIPSRKPTLSEAGTQQKLSSSGIPHFCNPFLQSTFWNNINFRYQHPFLSFFQKSACWPSCRRFAHYRMCRKNETWWNMWLLWSLVFVILRPHQDVWDADLRTSPVCRLWWLWAKNYAVFDSSLCISRWQRRYLIYHHVFNADIPRLTADLLSEATCTMKSFLKKRATWMEYITFFTMLATNTEGFQHNKMNRSRKKYVACPFNFACA